MKINKIAALFCAIIIFVVGCEDEEPFCWTETKYLDYSVKYQVTGTANSVSLTIENKNGGTSQFSDKSLPWSYTFTSSYDTWVYCSAQNQGSSGSVTVKILVNNNTFTESTSQGAYVIASAHGEINGDFHTEEIEHCD